MFAPIPTLRWSIFDVLQALVLRAERSLAGEMPTPIVSQEPSRHRLGGGTLYPRRPWASYPDSTCNSRIPRAIAAPGCGLSHLSTMCLIFVFTLSSEMKRIEVGPIVGN